MPGGVITAAGTKASVHSGTTNARVWVTGNAINELWSLSFCITSGMQCFSHSTPFALTLSRPSSINICWLCCMERGCALNSTGQSCDATATWLLTNSQPNANSSIKRCFLKKRKWLVDQNVDCNIQTPKYARRQYKHQTLLF